MYNFIVCFVTEADKREDEEISKDMISNRIKRDLV